MLETRRKSEKRAQIGKPTVQAPFPFFRFLGLFHTVISLAITSFLLYYIPMKLSPSLRTPENTDELKTLYAQNQLVYYTPLEELVNSALHASGAVFALIFMVFMLLASTSPAQYATAFTACFLIAVEFAVSAIYHGVSDMKAKLVWRKIDFPAVNLNVIACATATCLLYEQVYGYVALGISFFIAVTMFVLCAWRFDIFRKVSVASTFVIGGLMFAAFFTALFSQYGIPESTGIIYGAGLASCLLGAAIFGVHKRYVHCLFHFFVLVGPVLFLIATYLQILSFNHIG